MGAFFHTFQRQPRAMLQLHCTVESNQSTLHFTGYIRTPCSEALVVHPTVTYAPSRTPSSSQSRIQKMCDGTLCSHPTD
jgi:hypothetical protein